MANKLESTASASVMISLFLKIDVMCLKSVIVEKLTNLPFRSFEAVLCYVRSLFRFCTWDLSRSFTIEAMYKVCSIYIPS